MSLRSEISVPRCGTLDPFRRLEHFTCHTREGRFHVHIVDCDDLIPAALVGTECAVAA